MDNIGRGYGPSGEGAGCLARTSPEGGGPEDAGGSERSKENADGEHLAPRPRRWLPWASGLLLIVAGCADAGGSAQVAAAGAAAPGGRGPGLVLPPREPYEVLNLALIDINGSYVGAVANGSAFYRDVPPGYYRIAPESWGRDIDLDTGVLPRPRSAACTSRSSR